MTSKHCAKAGFKCPEPNCKGSVTINLIDMRNQSVSGQCNECHRIYEFDEQLTHKLGLLKHLIESIRAAEPILSDCNVAVTTSSGEVKVPYKLLLSRLNTLISIQLNGQKVNFNFWIEPTTESFR